MRYLRLLWREWKEFVGFTCGYFKVRLARVFHRFEVGKGILVEYLYQKRGKYARPFVHSGMMSLVFVGVTLGPVVIANTLPSADGVGDEYGHDGDADFGQAQG